MPQRRIAMTREEASQELHDLMHGESTRWWYAFAMGHGCSIANENDEIMQAIRKQDTMLRSIIRG
ncbi:MAG: hypothetical protein ACREBC_32890, partial [Pyrinomonadaceae bacterium]